MVKKRDKQSYVALTHEALVNVPFTAVWMDLSGIVIIAMFAFGETLVETGKLWKTYPV